MDVAPHTYPIPWRIDIATALVLVVLTLALVRPRYTLLFGATFLGGLLPDLVDSGPSLLNRFLGLNLPTPEIFAFHSWHYAVKAYLGHEVLYSVLSHLLVLGGCALLIFFNRRPLLQTILRQTLFSRKS
jgi:hypothetical protein